MKRFLIASVILLINLIFSQNVLADNVLQPQQLSTIVDGIVKPVMSQNHIAGMAVAVTMNNQNYFYNYGATPQNNTAITENTLFDLGSITKTFTATLAMYLANEHQISLQDPVSHYLPELKGSEFDHITLLNLATHTSGLPLFLPSQIKTRSDLMNYLKNWKSPYSANNIHRVYSNIGIGLLGIIIEKQQQQNYQSVLSNLILQPLQMNNTFVEISPDASETLLPAAVALKSTAADLIRYVQANMSELSIPGDLQQALLQTHTGYFKTPIFTQDMMWEQLSYPVTLSDVLTANSAKALDINASVIQPPSAPDPETYINKTGTGVHGSTVYLAYIPAKKIGVVILMSSTNPIGIRVSVGYRILTALDKTIS